MVKPRSKERRSTVRAKRVLCIESKILKPVNRRKFKNTYSISTTQDMSVGGLSFYTDQDYRIDDTLEIRVIMSGVLDIFKGKARVVRIIDKPNASHKLCAVKFLEKHTTKRPAKSYALVSRTTQKRSLKRI